MRKSMCKFVASWLVLGFLISMVTCAVLAAQEKNTVTLEVWHGWYGDRQSLFEEIIKRFEKKYPWIKVKTSVLNPSPGGELQTKLLAAIAAGVTPDIAMTGFDQSVILGQEGAFLPLGPFLNDDGLALEKVFYPPIAAKLKWRGSIYYLPIQTEAGGFLYWNADMFDAVGLDPETPPKTWTELESFAKKLTQVGNDGQLKRIGIDVITASPSNLKSSAPTAQFRMWLDLNAGSAFSSDGRRVEVGDKKGIQTLEWMVGFASRTVGSYEKVYALARGIGFQTSFVRGFAAMYAGFDYDYFQIKAANPDLPIRMAPRPYNDPTWKVRVVPGWGYTILSGTAHSKEAWLLLKWLTLEEDGGGWFMLQQGRPTPVPAFNAKKEYLSKNPYWRAVATNFEHGMLDPAPPCDWYTALYEPLNKAGLGMMPPAEALAAAVKEAQRRVDDFWKSVK